MAIENVPGNDQENVPGNDGDDICLIAVLGVTPICIFWWFFDAFNPPSLEPRGVSVPEEVVSLLKTILMGALYNNNLIFLVNNGSQAARRAYAYSRSYPILNVLTQYPRTMLCLFSLVESGQYQAAAVYRAERFDIAEDQEWLPDDIVSPELCAQCTFYFLCFFTRLVAFQLGAEAHNYVGTEEPTNAGP